MNLESVREIENLSL